MKRMHTILLTGFLIIVATTPAIANGPGLGIHYSSVLNQNTDERTDMLGAQLRLRGRYAGLEGSIDYRNDELGGNVELKSWPVSASLLIYPIPPVYALAGLGWYNSTIDFPDASLYDDATTTELGYHLGAGLEVPVSQALSLTGDFRYLFIDYEFDEIPSSVGKVNSDSFTLNAGLLFYLK